MVLKERISQLRSTIQLHDLSADEAFDYHGSGTGS